MTAKRHSTRREFLQGRAATDALLDATHGLGPTISEAEAPGQSVPHGVLMHVTRQAMACDFEIWLNAGQYAQGTEAALAALDRVEAIEAQMSVYRDDTELVALNEQPRHQPWVVDQQLFGLLEQSLDVWRMTDGAFDPTSGPLSRVWGFFYRAGKVPNQDELDDALRRTGGQHVHLDADHRTVEFLADDVELNVNGIGKGYALDQVSEMLRAAEVDDHLVHGGQSSVLAHGSHRTAEAADGWTIGLRHPLRPERRLAELRLRNQALATSGSATQHFYYQGRRYGHVLDPRSGRPAEGVYSATVVAASAALADALSTAFYVLGPEAALAYCAERDGLAAVLVCPGKRQ